MFFEPEEALCYEVDLKKYDDTHGLSEGYPCRRHLYEAEGNLGASEARADWAKILGPSSKFGNANPINGSFTALTFPLCRPERVRLVTYIIEYGFLYDDLLERDTKSTDATFQGSGLLNSALAQPKSLVLRVRQKQIQMKMVNQMLAMDKDCTRRVLDTWKEMITTSLNHKETEFATLEEYLIFRRIDVAGPWITSIILFGLGIVLTKEEDEQLSTIVNTSYDALLLCNDFMSFDREWEEYTEAGLTDPLVNAIWLCMRWHNIDQTAAKAMVRDLTKKYERLVLEEIEAYKMAHHPICPRIDRYLTAIIYEVSGNMLWSANCPRYRAENRYDPNLGLENQHLENPRFYNPTRGGGSLTSASSSEAEKGSPKAKHAHNTTCLPIKAILGSASAYVRRIWNAGLGSRRESEPKEKDADLAENVYPKS